ncbi:MAG: hypothetical protein Q3996_00270 [Candidatus Saccharibacteria bacterium]|nr:hypothetical protein [Candidatus Saccharibacteria bacterium]
MLKNNSIVVKNIKLDNSKILYDYQVTGKVAEVFRSQKMQIDYFEDISTAPKSIAVIPFLTNILPIAWVYDAIIEVDEIDEDFLNQLKDIKHGYQQMYPKIKFGGKLIAKNIIKNKLADNCSESALLFSGGVDATSSLITMLDNQMSPRLITLWGADVKLDDVDGWTEKSNHTKYVADLFQLKYSLIKSNFRTFINESVLDSLVEKSAGDMWWHGFQHGIGILGHAAPLIFKYNIAELHIAASFTYGNTVPCASDPTIDEHFTIAGNRTVHNGYDKTRQAKVKNIYCFKNNHPEIGNLPIKVCWKSQGAKNCGKCEKCMRTACEFLAEGGDVVGLSLEKFDGNYAKDFIINKFWLTENLRADWTGAQASLIKNDPQFKRKSDNINWLKEVDFNKINNKFSKQIKHRITIIDKTMRKLIPRKIKNIIKGN